MKTKDQSDEPPVNEGRRTMLAVGAAAVAVSTSIAVNSGTADGQEKIGTPDRSKIPSIDDLPKTQKLDDFIDLSKRLEAVAPLSAGSGETKGLLAELDELDIPIIARPIDTNAKTLLNKYSGDGFTNSPLQLEYLAETLAEHIESCLDLRRQAQEIEVQAASSRTSVLLDDQVRQISKIQLDLNKANSHRVLASMVDPKIDAKTGKISGKKPDETNAADFLTQQFEIDQAKVGVRKSNVENRIAMLRKKGGGGNHVERFNLIRALFEVEFIEAFKRARAVWAGAKHLHDLKEAIPTLANDGYLNDLAIWSKRLNYSLEHKLLKREETVISLPLLKKNGPTIMDEETFNQYRVGGVFKFKLTDDIFKKLSFGLKSPLLRGVRISDYDTAYASGDATNLSRLAVYDAPKAKITVPLQEIEIPDNSDTTFKQTPFVIQSEVAKHQSNKIPVENNSAIFNCSPIGDWEIIIEKRGTSNETTLSETALSNVILSMRISHEV